MRPRTRREPQVEFEGAGSGHLGVGDAAVQPYPVADRCRWRERRDVGVRRRDHRAEVRRGHQTCHWCWGRNRTSYCWGTVPNFCGSGT